MNRNVIFILLIFIGYSCSKDDRLTEYNITGDSELRVNNDTDDKCLIYFDNNFIGKMNVKEYRSWKVPSGIHVFKAKTDDYADYSQTDTFPKNGYKSIRLYVNSIMRELKTEPIIAY
jgi:hypothetical protein